MDIFEEETQYWDRLRNKLIDYKNELKATDMELKDGLSISRQPLSLFLNRKKSTLPISRSSLISLCNYLSDPKNLEKKANIPDAAKEKRLSLRQTECDSLLMAAGYLPQTQTIEVSSDLDKRQARQRKYREWSDEKTLEQWINDHPNIENLSLPLKAKLQETINRLCLFGESFFSDYEIDKVYGALKAEAEKSADINHAEILEAITLQVVSFSFKDISFSLTDHISDVELNRDFLRVSKRTESAIREKYSSILDNIDDSVFVIPPMTKTLIQVKFQDSLPTQTIYFCHISDNTHFKNAFAAIRSGMGYAKEKSLESYSTKVETLGEQTSCLVEAAVVLEDKNSHQKYISQWVDNNTVKSVIQATLNSTRDWLTNLLQAQNTEGLVRSTRELINYESHESYKNCCEEVNTIHTILDKSRQALGGYRFAGIGATYTLENVLEKIQKLKFKYQHTHFFDLFVYRIIYFECLAYWMLARAYHVQGNILKSKARLDSLNQVKAEIQDNCVVAILYEIEMTLLKFFSGNKEFLASPNQWLLNQSNWLSQLQDYLKTDHPEYGHFKESCNIDIYAIAAEIFGRAGRLSLTFNQGSFEVINHAIDNLLSAAHCCARIGHQKRAAHWLVNVSRAYSKIGDGHNASLFIKLATDIIELSIAPQYEDEARQSVSEEYRESVMAEVYLASAESSFLIEQDCFKASGCFIRALKGSIYLGFTRVISESLYGCSLALRQVNQQEFDVLKKQISDVFTDILKKAENATNTTSKYEKSFIKDKQPLLDFFKEINDDIQGESQQEFSQLLKTQAIAIWEQWHCDIYENPETSHPIAEMMANDVFFVDITGRS